MPSIELSALMDALTDATGAGGKALGKEGSSLAGFPVGSKKVLRVLHLAAGNTVFTPNMARDYDLIVSDNPSPTSLEVQSEVSMSWSRAANEDLFFRVERWGVGSFAVNFTGTTAEIAAGTGAQLIAGFDLDPATLGQYSGPIGVGTVGIANKWRFC